MEPIGDDRSDRASAIIACTLYNLNRGKGAPAMKPQDFMVEYDKPLPSQDELQAKIDLRFKALQAAYEKKR